MFQVNFSEQSMTEMNRLETGIQLQLMEHISGLTDEQLASPREPLGRFHRDGITYYRLRAGEYRIYFSIQEEILYCHYILPRNTLTDFVFRSKLPVTEEVMVENHKSFWKYLESLNNKS